MNQQIVTMKFDTKSPPSVLPDFWGQFCLCTVANESLLYIADGGIGGWTLLNNGDDVIPTFLARKDASNNYTIYDQSIQNAQIMCITHGRLPSSSVTPKGLGHLYIDTSNPVKPLMSIGIDDGAGGFEWAEFSNDIDTSNYTSRLTPNNYTNINQSIQDVQITTMKVGSRPPNELNIVPNRPCEFYLQLGETTADKKPRLWTSNGAKWEETTYQLPATVVQTSMSNNFQSIDQKISGAQILSFVDGGSGNPSTNPIAPSYDGQFYISKKKLSDDSVDLAIWVADFETSQWLPIFKDKQIDDTNYAKKNVVNAFTEPIQYLGQAHKKRQIIGSTIRKNLPLPIADATCRAEVLGEELICINDDATTIWKAVAINQASSLNEWKKVYDSNSAQVNMNEYAKLDKPNVFVPFQRIGVGNNQVYLTGAREGMSNPKMERIVPLTTGEHYYQTVTEGGRTYRVKWEAWVEGDTTSWVETFRIEA